MLRKLRRKWNSFRNCAVQCFWFALAIEPERIGFGTGLLTGLREIRHKKANKKLHISLLDYTPTGRKFGRLMTFWINQRSKVCSCSLNDRVSQADIVWIYTQDPISKEVRRQILKTLKETNFSGAIMNNPHVYNSYHSPDTFELLSRTGVNVPRCQFAQSEIGKTLVVYKLKGKHGKEKLLAQYGAQKAGYQPFEFVDGADDAGLYRRYRAFYLLDEVWPSTVLYSRHWNVRPETMIKRDYGFQLTETETDQVRLLADTLKLQFFAVDFLRRKGDTQPVYTDINIYPDITSYLTRTGHYGIWHSFDNFTRLGLSRPLGRPFWDMFDEKMVDFAQNHEHFTSNVSKFQNCKPDTECSTVAG